MDLRWNFFVTIAKIVNSWSSDPIFCLIFYVLLPTLTVLIHSKSLFSLLCAWFVLFPRNSFRLLMWYLHAARDIISWQLPQVTWSWEILSHFSSRRGMSHFAFKCYFEVVECSKSFTFWPQHRILIILPIWCCQIHSYTHSGSLIFLINYFSVFWLIVQVDMTALVHMTDADLKALGVPMVSFLLLLSNFGNCAC